MKELVLQGINLTTQEQTSPPPPPPPTTEVIAARDKLNIADRKTVHFLPWHAIRYICLERKRAASVTLNPLA